MTRAPAYPLRAVVGNGFSRIPGRSMIYGTYDYLECGHEVRQNFNGRGGVLVEHKRRRCKQCGAPV